MLTTVNIQIHDLFSLQRREIKATNWEFRVSSFIWETKVNTCLRGCTEEIKEWVTPTSYYITEGNFVSCCGRALSTYPLATCCRSKAAPLAAGQIEFSCFMTRCVRHWGALLLRPDKASVVNTELSSEIPSGPSVEALSDVFSLWPLCLPLCSPEFPFLTNLFFCTRKTSSSPNH